MACGGCARRREQAKHQRRVEAQVVQPVEPQLHCPACNVKHSASEYARCPFRLQLERQRAREARLKAKLAEKQSTQEVSAIPDRRGRQIYKQFPMPKVNIPTKRKW